MRLTFAKNMRHYLTTLLLLVCFFVSGCGSVHDEQITGPYRLIAVDIDAQMSLSYDLGNGSAIGRINETVFAYGFDKQYIVAMQHPKGNRSITHFYYLDMAKDSKYADPEVSVIGPLSKKDFDAASKRLGLPKISQFIDRLK